MRSIGFLGSGNMAQAIARGLAAADRRPERLLFTDSGSGRAELIAGELGGEAVDSNAELARDCDLLILGCKPKDLGRAAADAAGASAVLSILGATALRDIRDAFPDSRVQRAMPSLPVEIGQGVICTAQEGDRIEGLAELLGKLGRVEEVPEEALDAATAVMGCSPAYVDAFIDALAEAGVEAGLGAELSRSLVIDSVRGTSAMASEHRPGEIRQAVASPGGSTEAGLQALEREGFTGSVKAAARASLARMRGDI